MAPVLQHCSCAQRICRDEYAALHVEVKGLLGQVVLVYGDSNGGSLLSVLASANGVPV